MGKASWKSNLMKSKDSNQFQNVTRYCKSSKRAKSHYFTLTSVSDKYMTKKNQKSAVISDSTFYCTVHE